MYHLCFSQSLSLTFDLRGRESIFPPGSFKMKETGFQETTDVLGQGWHSQGQDQAALLLESRPLSARHQHTDIYEMRKMHKRRLKTRSGINTEQPNPRQPFPVSVCLCIQASIRPSVHPSLCCYLYVYLPIHLTVYPPTYLPIYLSTCLSLPISLSVHLSIYLAASQFMGP